MAVKIRLQRKGRKKRPFYHIVAADARSKRDGRFIERLGFYNPIQDPAEVSINTDRVLYWIKCGAQPTQTVKSILSKTGILYRKHLLRGVAKGAISQDVADQKFDEWVRKKSKQSKLKMTLIDWLEKEEASSGAIIRKPAMNEEKSAKAEAPKAKAEAGGDDTKSLLEQVQALAAQATAKAESIKDAVSDVAEEETPPATGIGKGKKPTDLKIVEGVGPKIEEALKAGGVNSWAELAGSSVDALKKILTEAEGNFGFHDPTTWPRQAAMAVEGKWAELEKWQDELDGGKEVK